VVAAGPGVLLARKPAVTTTKNSGDAGVGGRVASGAWRVLGATAAFALVHSLLASRRTKAAVRRAVGERAYDGAYRPLYNAQAVGTFAALVVYARRQPDRPLYEIRGPLAALMRAGQLAAAGYAAWAVGTVGLPTFAGAPGLVAWLRGDPALPPAPEAQGPAAEPGGPVRVAGPFTTSRHPLNLAFNAILLLQPRVTANFAAFTALSTAYLVAGSWHEETRLAAWAGRGYEAYRGSGVPFYVPGVGRGAELGSGK
jgi:protein-S-isoprenylcysteine O-methyltransferase Ste14